MTASITFGAAIVWYLAASIVTIGVLWWAASRAPLDTDLWEGGADPVRVEREARTQLYSLRSFERRTDHVVPVAPLDDPEFWPDRGAA